MNSSVHSYRQQSYTPPSSASSSSVSSSSAPGRAASPAKGKAAAEATRPQEPARATDARASTSPAEGLTTQEQQAIDQRFPEKPELAMKLYGRGQDTQTVNPDAVGSRLDVRG